MSLTLNRPGLLRFLHPIFFSIFPVLSTYALNIGSLDFSETHRAFIVAVFLAVLILTILKLVVKTWDLAAVLTSPIILCIFSYGHFYNAIQDGNFGGIPIRTHFLSIGLWILLLISWLLIVQWILKELDKTNLILSVMGLVMISFPLAESVGHTTQRAPHQLFVDDSLDIELHWAGAADERPDIFFIILDGYARADILNSIYDFDNSAFIDELEQRGFTIAEQSHSNYTQTLLSLSSTLNLDYVHHIIPDLDPRSKNRTVLEELIHDSQAFSLMRQTSYQLVAFDTPLPGTTITEADEFWKSDTNQFLLNSNYFENLLLYNSIFRLVLDGQIIFSQPLGEQIFEPSYEVHRDRTLHIFSSLAEVNLLDGNYFVIAHIVAPHPPFVFGPNGERLTHEGYFTLNDGSHFRGTQAEYIQLYRDQVKFISAQALETIAEIIETSETPPIIILQADHGPGAYLNWDDIHSTDLDERFAILNAIYLPGENLVDLPSNLSPVNTFRVIFNAYFSTDFPLLPDRSFFSSFETPYDLIEVTELLSH